MLIKKARRKLNKLILTGLQL